MHDARCIYTDMIMIRNDFGFRVARSLFFFSLGWIFVVVSFCSSFHFKNFNCSTVHICSLDHTYCIASHCIVARTRSVGRAISISIHLPLSLSLFLTQSPFISLSVSLTHSSHLVSCEWYTHTPIYSIA